ncbi:hypothetical protein ACFPJ4_08835 [Lysinimonas soli]|uniref:Uncharacterized protein n=1 Tax=Lysinimonas soli TaxID=1074233 RepID=A0ABW0NPJ5_9MICO
MPSIRFRFDDVSRQALTARVRSEFGATARIVSASEVRVGGVGGFFARRYLDVVVDVPPPAPNRQPSGAVGLAALLEQADRAERVGTAPTGAPVIPVVSTQTEDFARLMSELHSYSDLAPNAGLVVGAGVPGLRDEPGGVILFVGLGDDAMVVARSLARDVRASDVRMGGRILGDALPRVDDRRQAAAFTAQCVASGSVGLLAWGVGLGADGARASIPMLRTIDADQIWIVVDASRKPDDTAAWVAAVRSGVPAVALAVLHGAETATPESVNALGLPVGWSDTVG